MKKVKEMKQIKIVIPARYDSLRLPGKPLLLLKDKPIFWHVVQRALGAGVNIFDIVLATDNCLIEDAAKKLNIPVVMTSSSHSSGTDRVNEVANLLDWSDETVIINIQGDEPLVPSQLILSIIEFTQLNNNFDITTLVAPVKTLDEFNNPNIVKAVVAKNNQALYFSRSKVPFNREEVTNFSLAKRHIGIYGYKKSNLAKFCQYPESPLESYEKLEQLRAIDNGMKIGALETLTQPAHGIDTMDDYLSIKKIMEE